MDVGHVTRTLKRLRLRKSFAGQKLGRARTSAEAVILANTILLMTNHLGGSRRWRRAFSGTLTRWIHDEIDHTTATEDLLGENLVGRWIPEQLFTAAQLASALGLFEVSLRLEHRGLAIAKVAGKSCGCLACQLEQIQIAVHLGDVDWALAGRRQLVQNKNRLASIPASVQDFLNYVDVCAQNTAREFPPPQSITEIDAKWASSVADRQIVIYGPGMVAFSQEKFTSSQLIARVAGPGSHSWKGVDDLADGRTDIVYLTKATLDSIGNSVADQQKTLDGFSFICVSGDSPRHLMNARKVASGSRLFLRGHANMVPLMCIDLIRVQGTSIYVAGSDFFSSKTSYRKDSRRATPGGDLQTSQGSNGNKFDRTTLMASHNVFQNRRLIKNLVNANRVKGDRNFLDACALSDLEYAQRLDSLYGKHKI